MIGLCLGYGTLDAYARQGSAVSEEAMIAQQAAIAVVQSAEESQALFGRKAAAIAELMLVAYECCQGDWDGNGSAAVDPRAVDLAKLVVRQLPADVPSPQFCPEPDGSISLDWILSETRIFTLSVGASHRLAYAWVDGTDRGHGVARFDEEAVPRRVLEGVRGIVHHGRTTLGLA